MDNFLKQSLKNKKNKKIVVAIVVAVLVIGGIVAARFNGSGNEAVVQEAFIREIELKTVAELSRETTPLETIGTVRSRTEADLRAETQGRVVSVFKQLGESVTPGVLIAEIENARERASVVQAQGAVDAARAALLKARSGARNEQRTILEERTRDANEALTQTKDTTASVVRDAFEKTDDVVKNRIDDLFDSATSDNPRLKYLFLLPQLNQDVELGRVVVGRALDAWQLSLGALSSESDLVAFLTEAEHNVAQARNFVNDTAQGVNSYRVSSALSQSQINTWKANLSTSRSTMSSLASALSSQSTTLSNKEATLAIAQQELAQGVVGEREEDILTLEAQLTQALGALQIAQANLEKTRARSPIVGTVNNLSVNEGDFVSIFDPIATVANNRALEIESFVTAGDISFFEVGSSVLIDRQSNGTVTRVGSGLDPLTKKIKVQIGLNDTDVNLVHGDSVKIAISRGINKNGEVTKDKNLRIAIPVASLKVETDRVTVFTVDENNRLVGHSVIVGPLLGEKIIIEKGLTPEFNIVLDARGLFRGDEVVIKGK